MIDHALAVAETLAIYVALAVAYFGWGRATLKLLGIRGEAVDARTSTIWLGWAASLLVFQIVHGFFPLDARVVIPVLAVGLALAVPFLRAMRPPRLALVGIFTLVAVWIASHAMLPSANYDSGLYHFGAVRWINSYPIVPGLGNLHGRLAFNQSFFTYAAALNVHPWLGHGHGIANSFLFLLALAQIVERSRAGPSAPDLFALPILAYLAWSSDGLASPTPDLASTLLVLSLFLMVARGVSEWSGGTREQDFRVAVLAILSATAITIKLSSLAFCAVIFAACAAYGLRRPGRARVAVLATATAIVGVWMLRGVVLSGCPVYPSTLGCVQLDWAVPSAKVVDEANWVRSWARQPRVHWREVLGSWSWLGPWAARQRQDLVGVLYPLATSAVCLLLSAGVRRWTYRTRKQRPRPGDAVLLLPVIAGLAFWFVTAPDTRFVNGLFWLLSLAAAVILLASLRPLLGARSFMVAGGLLFAVVNAHFAAYAVKHKSMLREVSLSGWQAIPTSPMTSKTTTSGLTVHTPGDRDLSWDSALPSTPRYDPDLRLRVAGELGSGFTVEPP